VVCTSRKQAHTVNCSFILPSHSCLTLLHQSADNRISDANISQIYCLSAMEKSRFIAVKAKRARKRFKLHYDIASSDDSR